MKKKFTLIATASALALTLTLNSCIGSFALTNKLLTWNRSIDNKFVNELVFFAFWIIPVYEVSSLADILVLNSIEFWSGASPVASVDTMIEGQDGNYWVKSDENGYDITRMQDGAVTRLNFNAENREWSVVGNSGTEYPLLNFVDDTHVRMHGEDGTEHIIELSQQGVFAFQSDMMLNQAFACK